MSDVMVIVYQVTDNIILRRDLARVGRVVRQHDDVVRAISPYLFSDTLDGQSRVPKVREDLPCKNWLTLRASLMQPFNSADWPK